MIPSLTIANAFHRAALKTVTLAQNLSRLLTGTNLKCLCVRHFELSVASAKCHIAHVRLMVTEIKVIRIYAHRIVAFVKHMRTSRDVRAMKHPRDPVGPHKFGRNSATTSTVFNADDAISINVLFGWLAGSSSPQPASAFRKLPFFVETELKHFLLCVEQSFAIVWNSLRTLPNKATQMAGAQIIGLGRSFADHAFHGSNYTIVRT